MLNSIWWGSKSSGGRGINWCRWEQLCKPKTVGGLGFKKLYDFNLSLLSKQGWKFLTDHSVLVIQIYRAKYFQHTSFLHANLGSNPSYTWRSIHATKDLIRKHNRFRVGDGSQIMVTKDPWIPKDGSVLGSIPMWPCLPQGERPPLSSGGFFSHVLWQLLRRFFFSHVCWLILRNICSFVFFPSSNAYK